MRAGVGTYFYNAPISSHPGRVTLGTYAGKPQDLLSFVGNFFSRLGAALFKRIPGERAEGFLLPTEPPTI